MTEALALPVLTARQGEVMWAIRRYLGLNRYAPSMRELSAALGLKSTNAIGEHLDRLQAKGVLMRHGLTARSLVFTELGEAWLLANPEPPPPAPAPEEAA